MTTVSIIVPTKNMETSIASFLDSLYSQEFDGEFDVLIMDSSDDRTPEIVRDFPVGLVRVESEDYNYGKTRNEGAAITNGEFLVFLSADVEIPDQKWLSTLIRHFSDPKVGGVYGRQMPQEGGNPMDHFFIQQAYPDENEVLAYNGVKIKTKRMVFFSNTNSAIRRSVWQEIKIPEMLKSEDHEWAKRALLAGHKIVYDADAAVYHSNTYSLKRMFHEYFDTGALMSVISQERVVDQSFRRFLTDGLAYEFNQHKFLIRNGHWRWIPYAVSYDTAKFLGALLGTQQRYMPLGMKRALCKKKNHWNKYDSVIKEPS